MTILERNSMKQILQEWVDAGCIVGFKKVLY